MRGSVFHGGRHLGVDAAGQVIIRRQLKRRHVLQFFERSEEELVRRFRISLSGALTNLP